MITSSWFVGFIVIIFCFVQFFTRRRRPGEPPLDKGLIPWLGHAIELRRNTYAFLQRMQRKHGDTFTVCLGGKYVTYLLDPHDMSAVARESRATLDFTKYKHGLMLNIFGVIAQVEYGKAMFANNVRYLQGDGLASLLETMMSQLQMLMVPGLLDEGKGRGVYEGHGDTEWHEADLFDACYSIVFRAGYLTLFGQDPGGPAVQRASTLEAFKQFRKYDQLFPTIVSSLILPAQRKEAERIRSWFWERMTGTLVHARKHVAPWVLVRDEALAELQADQPSRDHTFFMLLWASQGNTGPAAFWLLAYLMAHRDAMAAVRAEVQQLLEATGQNVGAEARVISLTRDMLGNTPVLDSAIEEMLRLRLAPTLTRAVMQDVTLKTPGAKGGYYKLRSGDLIAMFPHLSPHMDPEVYKDPKEFKFDRFVNEDGSKKTNFFKSGRKLHYPTMPWGGGVSICPGRFFATSELKQFIILFLIHYDVEFCDPATKVPDINVSRFGLGVMHPTQEIRFRYRPRF